MGGWTWDNYDVYLVKTDSTNPRRLTHANYYQALRPNVTSDAKQVIFAADVPVSTNPTAGFVTTLMEVNTLGGKPPRPFIPLPKPGRNYGAWASDSYLSPDGNLIAFISDRRQEFNYDVHVMNRDGTGIQPLGVTAVSSYNAHPVIGREGRSVLYLAGTESNASSRPIFSLWEVDLPRGKPRKLADSSLFTSPSRWNSKAAKRH